MLKIPTGGQIIEQPTRGRNTGLYEIPYYPSYYMDEANKLVDKCSGVNNCGKCRYKSRCIKLYDLLATQCCSRQLKNKWLESLKLVIKTALDSCNSMLY